MKQALFIGAIASILTINSVFATSSTVTSKDYVDTQDALKQNKIPATGTNASTPGDTVVTYTQTGNGTIGERGIYAGNRYNDNTDANKLATADVVYRASVCAVMSTPRITCTEYDSNDNCLLMTVHEPNGVCDDDPFFGQDIVPCNTNSDCPNYNSGNHCGENEECRGGKCVTTYGMC